MSAGQFRGTSVEQDSRFSNKEKKLLKSLSKEFPPDFAKKVDISKVNWNSLKPWIEKRVYELLGGLEDEILLNFIFESIVGKKTIDPRKLQISLMGFLENNSGVFCKELWTLLQDASSNDNGIPSAFLASQNSERDAQDHEDRYRRRRDGRYDDIWERQDGHHRYRHRSRHSPVRSDNSRKWSYRSPDEKKDRGRRRRRSPSVEASYRYSRVKDDKTLKKEDEIKTEQP